MNGYYHYTECGLDNVWLAPGGFEYINRPSGRTVRIKDLEQLHRVIGKVLIEKKKDLTGRELRFLRQEMLLSQATLAKLLNVTEQTVHRWEKAKADIPKPAEFLIRFLYQEHTKDNEQSIKLRESLQRLADLEDEIDGYRLKYSKAEWQDLAA